MLITYSPYNIGVRRRLSMIIKHIRTLVNNFRDLSSYSIAISTIFVYEKTKTEQKNVPISLLIIYVISSSDHTFG